MWQKYHCLSHLNRRQVLAKVVLRHEALVLQQPRLAHARLAVEARRQLLEFLLQTNSFSGRTSQNVRLRIVSTLY